MSFHLHSCLWLVMVFMDLLLHPHPPSARGKAHCLAHNTGLIKIRSQPAPAPDGAHVAQSQSALGLKKHDQESRPDWKFIFVREHV